MASQLGPIEISCDAPTYAIVRACRRLGFHEPEDVPWHHYQNCQDGRGRAQSGSIEAVIAALSFDRSSGERCGCGERLPSPEQCMFALPSGRVETFFMGQCRRCRTMYWNEAYVIQPIG
jgi:hypothetical protein